VYYRAKPDAEFWARHWMPKLSSAYYAASDAGDLGWIRTALPRHLAPPARILDAGCGLGTYVVALRARGYQAEGVEWSGDLVEAVRRVRPELPIRQGDATALESPDGAFDGYVSLGVMEHREEGPQAFLREAWRVLKPGGMAFVSVPYLNALRRLKMRMGFFAGRLPRDLDFYLLAFDREDFSRELAQAGFTVVEQMSYGGLQGLVEELPFLRQLLRCPWLGRHIERGLRVWEWGEYHLGHVVLFVCRKNATTVTSVGDGRQPGGGGAP
jgi:SAM-dependent methyltransferase